MIKGMPTMTEYLDGKRAEPADLISRADAINAIDKQWLRGINMPICREVRTAIVQIISALPSAEAYFTDGNKIAEWIPCSEKLPSEDGCYLVSTTGTNNDVIDIAYYTEEIWHKASRIKAWMPLPKPYREDGEE